MKKSILIIPTYFCEKHCKYCMYRDRTYNDNVADIEWLIHHFEQFITKNTVDDIAIGNGGNLTALGYDYIRRLLDRVSEVCDKLRFSVPVTVLANIDTKEDVDMWERLLNDYDVQLCVSLNSERPFNKNTELCLNMFSNEVKQKINIITVFLPSLKRQSPKTFLDYIEAFGCGSLTINDYDYTNMGTGVMSVTTEQYYDFMIGVLEEYMSNPRSFLLKDVDILMVPEYDREGSVDYVVDVDGINRLSFVLDNTKTLVSVENGTQDEYLVHDLNKIKYNSKCLLCKQYFYCPERYKPGDKNEIVCSKVTRLIELVHAFWNNQ